MVHFPSCHVWLPEGNCSVASNDADSTVVIYFLWYVRCKLWLINYGYRWIYSIVGCVLEMSSDDILSVTGGGCSLQVAGSSYCSTRYSGVGQLPVQFDAYSSYHKSPKMRWFGTLLQGRPSASMNTGGHGGPERGSTDRNGWIICIPYGSKHLLRRYLTPQIILQTLPKKVLGSTGINYDLDRKTQKHTETICASQVFLVKLAHSGTANALDTLQMDPRFYVVMLFLLALMFFMCLDFWALGLHDQDGRGWILVLSSLMGFVALTAVFVVSFPKWKHYFEKPKSGVNTYQTVPPAWWNWDRLCMTMKDAPYSLPGLVCPLPVRHAIIQTPPPTGLYTYIPDPTLCMGLNHLSCNRAKHLTSQHQLFHVSSFFLFVLFDNDSIHGLDLTISLVAFWRLLYGSS